MNPMNPNHEGRAAQILTALGKSICYLLLFLASQFLVVIPYSAAVSIQLSMEYDAETASAIYAERLSAASIPLTMASGLLTITIVLAFYLLRRKKLGDALWLRPVPAPTLLSGACLAPAMYLLVTVVLGLLPEAWVESYNDAAATLDDSSFIAFLAIVVVAPVMEEFIFRGLIMTRLSRAMPGWLAAALSAAVFGLFHGHPVWFAYAFALGFLFGLMDLRAGSIWPSILGHLAFNLINQLLSMLPKSESGAETVAALGILLLAAILLPILNRRGVAAIFRPAPKAPPSPPPQLPADYRFDPWDE